MIYEKKDKTEIKLETLFHEGGFQRKYQANEMVFMENDREEYLFYIAKGLVKLFMISDDGKEKTLLILSEGQFFGEIALFDGMSYAVNAEILEDTVIFSMSKKDLTERLIEEPGIALKLMELMAKKTRLIIEQIRDTAFYRIAGRMASLLVGFSKQFGKPNDFGIHLQISLTHQELANLLGASRVTVTKTLNKFQEEGIIDVVNRRILIKDIEQLMCYIR
ncbi:MAG: Crp/Fnr family transcriptional regulator [Halanaerobiales bacterium]|nr:Crp/Fnr family transcriptional regulator [Halanaerobiales bacterium]